MIKKSDVDGLIISIIEDERLNDKEKYIVLRKIGYFLGRVTKEQFEKVKTF